MTKWIAPIAAVAIAFAPAAFAQTTPGDAKPDMNKGDWKYTPQTFTQAALMAGEKEVALSELAATKAQDAKVKEFAQMLASAHKQVNEQLRLVAKDAMGASRTDPPAAASPPAASPGAAPSRPPEHTQLMGMSGTAFDKAYVDMLVASHEQSFELYEYATETLPVGAAKKLAEDTLPKIEEHLEQAKSLKAQMMNK